MSTTGGCGPKAERAACRCRTQTGRHAQGRPRRHAGFYPGLQGPGAGLERRKVPPGTEKRQTWSGAAPRPFSGSGSPSEASARTGHGVSLCTLAARRGTKNPRTGRGLVERIQNFDMLKFCADVVRPERSVRPDDAGTRRDSASKPGCADGSGRPRFAPKRHFSWAL